MTIEQYKQALRLRYKQLRRDVHYDIMLGGDVNWSKDIRVIEAKLLRSIARLNGWLTEIEE